MLYHAQPRLKLYSLLASSSQAFAVAIFAEACSVVEMFAPYTDDTKEVLRPGTPVVVER